MGAIFIGMSGWTFEGWRGSFYPEGLKQKDELAYASRQVRSIEVNGTFYSLMKPASYQSWYEQTSEDFVFSIKGPKYITHERRLKDFEKPLSNFLASGLLALREKLGPILWQFPPNMPFDPARFEPFFAALPRDTFAAAALAKGHSDWLAGRTVLDVSENLPLRHAVEGRHPSFRSVAFVELARKYGIAIVVGDTDGRWPYIEDVCSDFIYLRLHADESKHPRGYSKTALERWAKRFEAWSLGSQPVDAELLIPGEPSKIPRLVFAYFDNEVKETAALNAVSISAYLTQLQIIPPRKFTESELRQEAKPPRANKAKTEKKVVGKKKVQAKTKSTKAKKAKVATKTKRLARSA